MTNVRGYPMVTDHRKTKYVLLVGDGMADYPLGELGGKTPLQKAETPHMDRIAACRVGLVKTIPEGMDPGSDVANLSVLGYDPRKYYTGRAPLEAASMGISLGSKQVAFRMNLVTLDVKSDREIIMLSHSAGDISTEESVQIVEDLKKEIDLAGIEIYTGVAYRHILLWEYGPENAVTIPPHDVLEQNMASFLKHASGNPVVELIRGSWGILKDHPINIRRRRAGLYEANSIWLWGQGTTPNLPLFSDKYGLEGAVISAVDLVKGIGVCIGFTPIPVQGATGYLNTNYLGKAEAALNGLRSLDLIFVHVEAPDEAGHNANYREKIEAIENFDEKVVGTILEGSKEFEDYRIMVVSDHLTPIVKRTHTSDPTPFAWATKRELESHPKRPHFSEAAARESGLMFGAGHELIEAFLSEQL
jgi:2,3-bisphosphoglycerate-independent phosphoglycerate mutase